MITWLTWVTARRCYHISNVFGVKGWDEEWDCVLIMSHEFNMIWCLGSNPDGLWAFLGASATRLLRTWVQKRILGWSMLMQGWQKCRKKCTNQMIKCWRSWWLSTKWVQKRTRMIGTGVWALSRNGFRTLETGMKICLPDFPDWEMEPGILGTSELDMMMSQALRKQCQNFATALLDHTRSSGELGELKRKSNKNI